jgi:uncharacterized MAPEG superfamily protein
MTSLLTDPSFKLYALCCVILSLQMLILGGMTAARRSKHKGYLNPEDNKVSFKDAKLVEGAEHPETARIQRAHRNLNESLPIFFGLGLIAILAGISPLGAKICFGVFTGARVLHSIVYLNELQPWRTLTFAIATFSLIGLAVQIAMAALA